MLGSKVRGFAIHPAISLEQLVPPDDFYRFLDAKLDLSFVRDWVGGDYAVSGRPSIDPVVFFRLQLILFFEGLRSERQLMRVVADRLSLRWYLGYDFGEPLPDHSSLTRIRTRYGQAVFHRFFDHVVELCQAAGLVWGRELIFDSTQVQANAAVDSLAPRFYLKAKAEAHLATLFPDGAAGDDGGEEPGAVPDAEPELAPASAPVGSPPPTQLLTGLAPAAQAELAAANQAQWRLLDEQRLDPERAPHLGYQRTGALRVSTTDPDAVPMQLKGGGTKLGYRDHYVVDGGTARIILAALVLPADVRDNLPLPDLTRRVCFRWRLRPERAIADSAYGTGENVRILEEMGIRAYMPIVDGERAGPFFKHADFTYDAERDVYTCPQGATLKPWSTDYDRQVRTYQAPSTACAACPVRERCTKGARGRALSRHFDEAYRERVRGYHRTAAYRRAMRKRAVWVEPLFGEAKDWHGLRRFRLRGLENVNIEGLRVAAGQNLKRLLAATGWGRRQAPCGSMVAGWLPTMRRAPTAIAFD